MTQQPTLVPKIQHSGIFQQCQMAGLGKARTNQKIPVAMHQKQLSPLAGCPQRLHAGLLEGFGAVYAGGCCGEHIITHPGFKEVTQNENCIGLGAGQVVLPKRQWCGARCFANADRR